MSRRKDILTIFVFIVSPGEFLDSEVERTGEITATTHRQKEFSWWTSKKWADYNKYSRRRPVS
jgi:hypothetical protein